MDKIPAPQEIDKSLFRPDAAHLTTGLVFQSRSCSASAASFPTSGRIPAVEYAHTKDSQKKTINFDAEGIATPAGSPRRNTRPLTG